jgi:hypothetical protein
MFGMAIAEAVAPATMSARRRVNCGFDLDIGLSLVPVSLALATIDWMLYFLDLPVSIFQKARIRKPFRGMAIQRAGGQRRSAGRWIWTLRRVAKALISLSLARGRRAASLPRA